MSDDINVQQIFERIKAERSGKPPPPKREQQPPTNVLAGSAKTVDLSKYFDGSEIRKPKTKPPPSTGEPRPINRRGEVKIDVPIDEEDEEKQKLLMILYRYRDSKRFAKHIKEHNFKFLNLEKKSIADLRRMIGSIRFCVNNKQSGLSETALQNMLRYVETVANRASMGKLDMTGLTQDLMNDEEFLDLAEQLSLEYSSFLTMDYRIRLAGIVMWKMYLRNLINQQRKMIPQNTPVDAPVDAGISTETPADDIPPELMALLTPTDESAGAHKKGSKKVNGPGGIGKQNKD